MQLMSQDILGISLGYFGDILGIFWVYFGNILGIFLGYFGDIFGIFWVYFGDILGIFWECFWDVLVIFWRYFGDVTDAGRMTNERTRADRATQPNGCWMAEFCNEDIALIGPYKNKDPILHFKPDKCG